MRSPLVNIARLKGVERELARIADLLEIIVRDVYGFSTAKPDSKSAVDDGDVSWTDQDVIDELERLEHEGKDDEEIKRRIELIEDARKRTGKIND